jgi:hypothetical protein
VYDDQALHKRPKLAIHIAYIAQHWTLIDLLHGELLSILLGKDARFTTSVYLKLRGARPHALNAVAEEVLPEDLLKEFRQIMNKCRDVEGERNDVIHGMWATSEDDEDALIWVDPAAHVKWRAARAVRTSRSKVMKEWARKAVNAHLDGGLSYKEEDFIAIEKRIVQLFSTIYQFGQRVEKQLRRRPKANRTLKSLLQLPARIPSEGSSQP